MLVFLFVVIIVLSILAKCFNISFEGSVDLYQNKGHFIVRMSSIPIYSAEMYFERTDGGNNSIIIKKGSKRTEIHLNADKKDDHSIVRIANYPAFEHVLIKDLNIRVNVGKKDDAFFTTIIISSIRLILYSVLSFIKTRFDTDINESFEPEYNTDKFIASFSGTMSLSLADVMSSYFISKINKKKRLQEVKQN